MLLNPLVRYVGKRDECCVPGPKIIRSELFKTDIISEFISGVT